MVKKKKFRLTFNSPVILCFVIACFVILIFNQLTGNWLNQTLFSVYRSSLLDPITYFRFFAHSFGHSSWNHLFNNLVLIMLIGPTIEEKYGSGDTLFIILVTALVTGIMYVIFVPNGRLVGASGVVYAFILLSSITRIEEGEIPITFVLVALFYFGKEIRDWIFVKDNVSHFTHIIGGIVGSILGYYMNIYLGKKKRY